jgi:type III restriction enzyme
MVLARCEWGHDDYSLNVANLPMAQILSTLKAEFPTLEDFEREFPSLCFALATGVGKTRLMGAFIAYLHLAHGINNFFVLAPNLTIYNKLIADFTRNTPKYVFKGIAEFAQQPPLIITGDNYDQTGAAVGDQSMGFAHDVRINIFNISKINSEVRGGKEPRIKRMKECWATATSTIWRTCPTWCC